MHMKGISRTSARVPRHSSSGDERRSLIVAHPISDLTETRVRHGFIQKVYGILSVQLLGTVIVSYFIYNLDFARNPELAPALLFGSFAVSIGVMCYFMCNPEVMRKSPQNYILLAVFTLAKAVLVGFISAQYTQESVLFVFGVTTIVVFSLTLFACQTSVDFTGLGPYLFAAVMTLFAFGFVIAIAGMLGVSGPSMQAANLVYAGFGSLVFSFYLVYDTQKIVGGKHQHQFGIDDYAMGAIALYIDVVQLFLFMLRLFGDRR